MHHWKEGHLHLTGELISIHSELGRMGKNFYENLFRNGFYNNEILAIFKNLPEIQNNQYNPVIRLKSFVNTSCVQTSMFPIMCRDFSILRGPRKRSLLESRSRQTANVRFKLRISQNRKPNCKQIFK